MKPYKNSMKFLGNLEKFEKFVLLLLKNLKFNKNL